MPRQRKRRLITPTLVTVTPTTATDTHPGTEQFAVVVKNVHGTTITNTWPTAAGTWSSSNALAATINQSGLATSVLPVAVASGTGDAGSTDTVLNDTAAVFGGQNFSGGGYILKITGGAESGSQRTILSNTATSITVSLAFAGALDGTSLYEVYHTRVANINFTTAAGAGASLATGTSDATPAVYTVTV